MKDKRLDALLATLPHNIDLKLDCFYYRFLRFNHFICTMTPLEPREAEGTTPYPETDCQGDLRKCEREE